MPTVFIAGSIKIRKLHPLFVERISNIVSEGLAVIVAMPMERTHLFKMSFFARVLRM